MLGSSNVRYQVEGGGVSFDLPIQPSKGIELGFYFKAMGSVVDDDEIGAVLITAKAELGYYGRALPNRPAPPK